MRNAWKAAAAGLLLAGVSPGMAEASKPALPGLVEGNTAFACDLYAKLKDQPGNLFFSPYSISTALAMTYGGARGETEAQMAKTLRFPFGGETLHACFGELQGGLKGDRGKDGYELAVANRLFGQKGHRFLDPFLALNRDRYGAPLEALDFAKDTEGARKTINSWVEERTKDKIRELLKPGVLDADTRLVLTNAIYFKGDWASAFDKKATRDAIFHPTLDSGRKVQTMSQTADFPYAETDLLQALELPYKGNALSMVVLLPRKEKEMAALEAGLSPDSLQKWIAALGEQEVEVSLPRFKLEPDSIDLKKTLSDMGMPDAFNETRADFSGTTNDPQGLHVSEVIHKAFIDVNEEGTEAAAATAVAMKPNGIPDIKTFRADRPFLFLIRDKRTGSILFMGRVTNP